LLLLLSACASDSNRRPEPSAAAKAQAQQLAANGYQAAEQGSMSVAMQDWIVEGERLPVSLAWPGGGQALPLVVYLPGLGESAQAGLRWRQAWARAGYAVLSVQPLEADANAWSSDLARAADFKGLARQHRQATRLMARMHRLTATLAEARRRAAAGDVLWSRVDFSRMAVAGYDLGTQAAAKLAPDVKATLLISPSLTGDDLPMLKGPLLLISSHRDTDPTGLIDSPGLRTQAFEQLPVGDSGKYLLLLDTASHASLAGGTAPELEDFVAGAHSGRQSGGQGGGRHRGGSGSGGGGGGGKAGPDSPARHASAPMARSDSHLASSVAVEGISIAFLDATLRDRPAATQWLQNDAVGWLLGLGELQQR
jgi:dienelactone hydrolase